MGTLEVVRLLAFGPEGAGGCGGLMANLIASAGAAAIGVVLGFPLAALVHHAGPRRAWVYHLPRRMILSVPLLLIVFWVYYVIPRMFHCRIDGLVAGMLAMGCYASVYLCEVFRAGLAAVDREQWEMARQQGFTTGQMLAHIVVPQSMPVIVPSLIGFCISLFKDSTVIVIIGVSDLTQVAAVLSGRAPDQLVLWYAVVGGIFFVGCWLLSRLQRRVEARVGGKRTGV